MMFWLYIQQQLKVKLAYRADFLVAAGADLMLAGVGYLFLRTLFSQVDRLGAWSAPETLFCWGFAEAIVGLFFVLFQGLYQLNHQYILGAELDRLLLRPLDPMLQILADHLSPEHLPIVALGIAVMGMSAQSMPPVESWRWLLLPIFLASGVSVIGGLLTGLSGLGFRLHHRGTAVGLVFQLSTFNRYPMDLFPRLLRYALTFLLPLGFAGFYPASFLMGHDEWLPYALATPLVGLFCLAAGWHFWHRSLQFYTSGGG